MPFDIDTARKFLKADGPDDDVITNMLPQAQSICEGYCNRRFYADAETAEADFIEALTDRADALANRATLLTSHTDAGTQKLIRDHYIEVLGRIKQRCNGIAIDGLIEAAIYLTLGHLYINREDNVVSGNNAVQVPVGAQRILQPYLWIGDLADDSDDSCVPGS